MSYCQGAGRESCDLIGQAWTGSPASEARGWSQHHLLPLDPPLSRAEWGWGGGRSWSPKEKRALLPEQVVESDQAVTTDTPHSASHDVWRWARALPGRGLLPPCPSTGGAPHLPPSLCLIWLFSLAPALFPLLGPVTPFQVI